MVKNAVVYTVNDSFDTAASFAVKDEKIIAVGNDNEIESQNQLPLIQTSYTCINGEKVYSME